MNPASCMATAIILPLAAGALCLVFTRARSLCRVIAFPSLAAVFVFSIFVFARAPFTAGADVFPGTVLFSADRLAALICLGIGFFSLLIGIYSSGFFAPGGANGSYYGLILLTEGAAITAALANNLVLLLCAWGFTGLTLYLLIAMGREETAPVAKKAMIMVGGSDAFMMLGVCIVAYLSGAGLNPLGTGMSGIRLPLSGGAAVAAYLCLAAAAFAKAGAMPLHSWVPDCAESAPIPVTALLPASLDKLLGIYLLARLSLSLFIMDGYVQIFLMAIGAITIVCAVMMAMIQHDMRRLLGYHAVSQVGYMVLGIGCGNPVGIAGGLFHMVNHALYKSCLFLTAGSVGKQTGTYDLDKLGGLAGLMPVSFASCLVAALSISGIPPLNGFASKWMVYQGLIEMGRGGGRLWAVWLIAAMFGSVLTLASFVKILNATFLGRPSAHREKSPGAVKEAPAAMAVPGAILAGFCVIFGIFAMPLALEHLIIPAIGMPLHYPGFWNPVLATWLIVIGAILGLIVYKLSAAASIRESEPFSGGEAVHSGMAQSGVDFYNTIREIGLFAFLYGKAEEKYFDLYDRTRDMVLALTKVLRRAHSGLLPLYLFWCLAGLIALFWFLGG